MLNEKGSLFRQLHISQNAPCLPAKILHKHCFQFLFGRLLNRGVRGGGWGGGGKQGVLREWYKWRIGHFRVTGTNTLTFVTRLTTEPFL